MKVDFIIDGESVGAASGATFVREDPVTGAAASEAAAAGLADVAKVVEAAARAFPAWSETGPSERRAFLLKAADLLEARTADFIKAMTEEIGATGPWGGFNVHFAASLLREAAALTTQITGEIIPADKPGVLSLAVRQPAGVVLGIAPWNAPVILGVRAIAAPLACGNTVILRSSETCPATHRMIVEVMNEAGFPRGVVNFISNAPQDAPKIVAELIAHPAVKRVNFTGSSRVGKEIAKLCAEHLKPALLELGGKAPLVVLADADLDAAVDAAVFGAFMNQGQICMSTERLIVDELGCGRLRREAREARERASSRRSSRACRVGFARQRLGRRADGRTDRRRESKGWEGRRGRHAHRGYRGGDGHRPSHPGHAHLCRGILWTREARGARQGRRRGGPRRQ